MYWANRFSMICMFVFNMQWSYLLCFALGTCVGVCVGVCGRARACVRVCVRGWWWGVGVLETTAAKLLTREVGVWRLWIILMWESFYTEELFFFQPSIKLFFLRTSTAELVLPSTNQDFWRNTIKFWSSFRQSAEDSHQPKCSCIATGDTSRLSEWKRLFSALIYKQTYKNGVFPDAYWTLSSCKENQSKPSWSRLFTAF